MKNPVFDVLTQAIDGHFVVRLFDEVGPREIEPYLIFESADGDMLVHGWQRSGICSHVPPPVACNVYVDDIISVEMLSERFGEPHGRFDPRRPEFHRIVYVSKDGSPPLDGDMTHHRSRTGRRAPPSDKSDRMRGRY